MIFIQRQHFYGSPAMIFIQRQHFYGSPATIFIQRQHFYGSQQCQNEATFEGKVSSDVFEFFLHF